MNKVKNYVEVGRHHWRVYVGALVTFMLLVMLLVMTVNP